MDSPFERVTDVRAHIRPRRAAERRVPLIPASYFGIVLGLGGLGGSWRVAHAIWGVPASIGEVIFAIAGVSWLLVTALYAWKWISAFDVALEESEHPVKCCFIGLGGVSALIIAQGALPYTRDGAWLLFIAGVAFTIGFGVWRTGLLWQGGREVDSNTPVLLLPVVAGGFVIAGTAGALGWHEWATLAFGAALFSWLAIESVVLHRLYTATALPPPLRPTLGIQLAPPSVGALAYLATSAENPAFVAKVLVGYALLQALLLLRMWPWITKQPFAPSYWAITFGVTALPTALMKISSLSTTHEFTSLAFVLFVVSNLIVGAITVRTILWFGSGEDSAV